MAAMFFVGLLVEFTIFLLYLTLLKPRHLYVIEFNIKKQFNGHRRVDLNKSQHSTNLETYIYFMVNSRRSTYGLVAQITYTATQIGGFAHEGGDIARSRWIKVGLHPLWVDIGRHHRTWSQFSTGILGSNTSNGSCHCWFCCRHQKLLLQGIKILQRKLRNTYGQTCKYFKK